jgi:hypothetical protein
VQHGREYRAKKPATTKPIKLRQSRKFSMRNKDERLGVFELLAKLLWHLQSGRAHVGFLFDHATNPIHDIVFRSAKPLTLGIAKR